MRDAWVSEAFVYDPNCLTTRGRTALAFLRDANLWGAVDDSPMNRMPGTSLLR